MCKNNSSRFPTTALLNPQPRPTEKKHVGLMMIDEQTCEVCGDPVADIHDKFCSKRCVAINNGTARLRSTESKSYYQANKEIILEELKAKRAKA